MLANILLQIQEGTSTAVQTTSSLVQNTEKTMNIFNLASKGGWIMIALIILLVIAVYIFVERYIAINNAEQEDENFISEIKNYINKGDLEGARILTKNDETPIGKILDKGLSRIGRPITDISNSIEQVGKLEILGLEKRVSLVNSISCLAICLGGLGTSISLLTAFFNMSLKAGEINFIGIYQSMITLVIGLIIGIICKILYYILEDKINKIEFLLETRKMEFIDFLQEPANQ
jgi:biopolymer transport protein ExbB